MSNTKQHTYGVHRVKEAHEPVFPNIVKLDQLIKVVLVEVIDVAARKFFEYLAAIDVEVEDSGKEHLNKKAIIQELGMLSFEELGKLVDNIKGTTTKVNEDEGTARVTRGKDHDGIGFYPITAGCMVKLERNGKEVEGVIPMPNLEEDGTIEVYLEEECEYIKADPLDLWRV